MKSSFILLGLVLITFFGFSQSGNSKFPSVDVKTLNNQNFNTKDFDNNGQPIIISFWATWCTPCKKELNTIAEVYDEWQEETGVKLIAISIDDARNMPKVAPTVKGLNWEYEVYLDINQDLKRAMNVNSVPHTFLLDGNKEVVWQHNSYSEGDEDQLFELVKKLAKGESISH
jgi:cytochrome c biogenesis protein CcmG, thiol:disulfide interchange protein DsbE